MCSSAKRTHWKPIRTSGYVFLFLSAISTNLKKILPRFASFAPKIRVFWTATLSSYYTEGRKHDAGSLADSGLLAELQRSAYSLHGRPMCLYGDPAYLFRVHLQAPFRNAVLPPPMQAFNARMSVVRESVKWFFNDIVNYFKFVDFKKIWKLD